MEKLILKYKKRVNNIDSLLKSGVLKPEQINEYKQEKIELQESIDSYELDL